MKHQLAKEIAELVANEADAPREFSVFLCGANSKTKGAIRDKLRERIEASPSRYAYRVYYPEVMFAELLYGHGNRNLLSLENLLAENVSAVVLILESPGSFAELGAFANHPVLAKRLIVVIRDQYRKDKSFINLGPVRLLKDANPNRIIYSDFDSASLQLLAGRVRDMVRHIESSSPAKRGIVNPVVSFRFYLAMAYCFDPFSRKEAIGIVRELVPNAANIEEVVETVSFSLIREGFLVLGKDSLIVTKQGEAALLGGLQQGARSAAMKVALCKIRSKYLNFRLRKKEFSRAGRLVRSARIMSRASRLSAQA